VCASVRASCCQGLDSFNEPTTPATSAATTMGTMHKQQQYTATTIYSKNNNNNNNDNNHGPHVQKLFSIETKDKQEASVAQKERR